MLLRDWVDIAWSKVVEAPGGLVNPFEFASSMYKAFWLGEAPKPKPKSAKEEAAAARASMGKAPPKAALDALAALTQRAAELKQSQQEPSE